MAYDAEKFDSTLNTFREIYSNPAVDKYRGTVILPLDFSLEMDGISGIIPNSAFEIPVNSLPSSYLVRTGVDTGKSKIAFILHSIDHNFGNNKWTTKITGQTLNIRFDKLTSNQEKAISEFVLPTLATVTLIERARTLGSKGKGKGSGKGSGKGYGKGYDYVNSKYGQISDVISENSGEGLIDKSLIVTLTFPYPMYFDGKLTKTTTVHKLVIKNLETIFKEILSTFGLEKIKKLGLDKFSGAYYPRLMRGGTTPSMHSWGIAIDLNGGENGFDKKTGTALFSKPEYKTFIDIWYKHGFKSFGKEKGYDWMHFQVNDVMF